MEYMLTTVDNPFDPFTQWDEWLKYDTDAGYFTCGLFARIARTSEELSESDQELSLVTAMDEVIELDPLARYIKVTRETTKLRNKKI